MPTIGKGGRKHGAAASAENEPERAEEFCRELRETRRTPLPNGEQKWAALRVRARLSGMRPRLALSLAPDRQHEPGNQRERAQQPQQRP